MNRLLAIFFVLIGCMPVIEAQPTTVLADSMVDCTIIHIDSLCNYYVITATSNAERYFIVSRKTSVDFNSKRIIEGENYVFALHVENTSYDGLFQLGQSGCFYKDQLNWDGIVCSAKELCGTYYCEDLNSQYTKEYFFEESLEGAITNLWIRSPTKNGKDYSAFRESVLSNMYSETFAPFSTTIYSFPSKSKHIKLNGRSWSVVYNNRRSLSVISSVKCYLLASRKQFYYVFFESNDCSSYGWIPKRIYKKLPIMNNN